MPEMSWGGERGLALPFSSFIWVCPDLKALAESPPFPQAVDLLLLTRRVGFEDSQRGEEIGL